MALSHTMSQALGSLEIPVKKSKLLRLDPEPLIPICRSRVPQVIWICTSFETDRSQILQDLRGELLQPDQDPEFYSVGSRQLQCWWLTPTVHCACSCSAGGWLLPSTGHADTASLNVTWMNLFASL